MKPIRILHVVPNMNSGGIENLIMNLYRNIDRNKVQFDFLVHYHKRGVFDNEIEQLGGKIYRFSIREDNNIIKYIKQVDDFFKRHRNEYNIIHGHMASLGVVYLGIAKKYDIPIRIAHSHGTSYLKTIKGYMKYILFKLTKYKANVYYSCSTEAGQYLFGNNRNFEIIPNAINMEKFEYNEDVRKILREELDLKEKLVIGNVGRFNLQKNHEFIIDIFNEIKKKKSNSILLLIGIGEEEKRIRQKVKEMKLEESVRFLGLRNDVERLYQAMDIFLMPSLFEGLPLTGIEAQASKLKCIFSDTITKEVKITNNVEFLSLKLPEKKWADKILEVKNYDRKSVEITNKDFDIRELAKKMEKVYIEYNKRKKE